MPEHVETTVRVAEMLGTPTAPLEAMARCGDLAELRRVLAERRVSQPRWAEVFNADSAVMQAEVFGYPVLIKNSGSARTFSVQAWSPSEVSAAYESAARPVAGGPADGNAHVLVEEDPDGEQVSAEMVVLDEEDIRVVAITRTVLGPPPARQSVRHCVFAHDPLLHNPILRQILTRTVRALGIKLGVLSVRMRLTRKGPRVTDVSPHLAGDLIPLVVKHATGVDLPRIAGDLAIGRTPKLTAIRQRAAAVQFLYAPVTGHVHRLAVHPHAERQPLLDRIVLTQQLGNHVTSGPHANASDRIAHLVVLGPDAPSCHSVLDRASQYVHTEIEPVQVEPAGSPVMHVDRHAWTTACSR
ncbi:hypothetical protein ACH5A3_43920 [Streptomyces echinatus]|uniref:hypothetical protein n=1 Tax=Streptomyces echinatus TaxID=67293 RepID=UPI0037A9CA0A